MLFQKPLRQPPGRHASAPDSRRGEEPGHVLPDHVELQVHAVAGGLPAQRGVVERVRDDRDGEPVRRDLAPESG